MNGFAAALAASIVRSSIGTNKDADMASALKEEGVGCWKFTKSSEPTIATIIAIAKPALIIE